MRRPPSFVCAMVCFAAGLAGRSFAADPAPGPGAGAMTEESKSSPGPAHIEAPPALPGKKPEGVVGQYNAAHQDINRKAARAALAQRQGKKSTRGSLNEDEERPKESSAERDE